MKRKGEEIETKNEVRKRKMEEKTERWIKERYTQQSGGKVKNKSNLWKKKVTEKGKKYNLQRKKKKNRECWKEENGNAEKR